MPGPAPYGGPLQADDIRRQCLEFLDPQFEPAIEVPIVTSGGASTPAHMAEAVRAGADAVLAASIFHYSEYTVGRLKRELASLGVRLRVTT